VYVCGVCDVDVGDLCWSRGVHVYRILVVTLLEAVLDAIRDNKLHHISAFYNIQSDHLTITSSAQVLGGKKGKKAAVSTRSRATRSSGRGRRGSASESGEDSEVRCVRLRRFISFSFVTTFPFGCNRHVLFIVW